LVETVYIGRLYKIAAIFLQSRESIPDAIFGELVRASGKVDDLANLPDDNFKDGEF
jgi:hypothetical protein